jgi:aminopeptidase N
MLGIANCVVAGTLLPLRAAPPARPYQVENYDLAITADLGKQILTGEVRIRLHSQVQTPVSALELDAGAIEITRVREGSNAQYFERKSGKLFVALAIPLHPGEHRILSIGYQAPSSAGLRFFSDQVYTSATSDWMPCNDSPDERSTLHLTIAASGSLKSAASGVLIGTRSAENQQITEWRLDSATPPSLFGFALGAFPESSSEADGVKLRTLGAGADTLEPAAAALRYLGERTGKRYPGSTYTQVFVHGDVHRSLAGGLLFLPESYAQEMSKQPDALRSLADESAHQWYGIGITATDSASAWLSEALPAFLADSFLGQRLGKEALAREVERSRQIYNQSRVQGSDQPLAYASRDAAETQSATDKGVYFLYLVQEMVGERAFGERLQWYTAERWNKSASNDDFESAFRGAETRDGGTERQGARRKATGPKTLDKLFDQWVYGVTTRSKK